MTPYDHHQQDMDQLVTEAIIATAERVGLTPGELMRAIHDDPPRGLILDRSV